MRKSWANCSHLRCGLRSVHLFAGSLRCAPWDSKSGDGMVTKPNPNRAKSFRSSPS